MHTAECTGCGQDFPIGPLAELDVSNGKLGYCANLRRKVEVELTTNLWDIEDEIDRNNLPLWMFP